MDVNKTGVSNIYVINVGHGIAKVDATTQGRHYKGITKITLEQEVDEQYKPKAQLSLEDCDAVIHVRMRKPTHQGVIGREFTGYPTSEKIIP